MDYLRMDITRLYLALITLLMTLLPGSEPLKWLSLARISSIATTSHENNILPEALCENATGLVHKQVRLCKKNLDVMDGVRRGARMAIEECRHQFSKSLWNCTSLDAVRLSGTRESAFVHSISAAGVAHAVTRSCSMGELDKCGCDVNVKGRTPEGYQWAGCSDNIAFGSAFSKNFVDARERSRKRSIKSTAALLNIHNNRAGRKAIELNMKVECKCHGVSGSCEVRTCWRAMPAFRKVGDILKEKYDGATEVMVRKASTRRRLEPVNAQYKFRADTDLVYMDRSPDFCQRNRLTGSLGTAGRTCNVTSPGPDGCDIMCCGRGYDVVRTTRISQCECKFHWCCEVRCKNCTKTEENYRCR